MSLKVSAGTLTKYRSLAEGAMKRARAAREKGEEVVGKVARTAVTGTTAFALGMVQGRTGGTEVFGVPLDLLVGLGGHVAGFMRIGGKHSDQLHNVGDGGIATYAATMGRSVGLNWKTTGRLTGAKTAGALPEGRTGGISQSDEELAASVMRR